MTTISSTKTAEAQQTNDLVHLFSTTLHSLAADAAAVRQATSLAHCLGVKDGGGKEVVDDDRRRRNFQDGLWDLEELVSGLEEKVTALRQIVSEEKRAVTKFETTLQQEAEEQAALMSQIVQALEEHEQQQQQQQQASKPHHASLPPFDEEEEDEENRSTASSTSSKRSSSRGGSRRDSVDPRRRSSGRDGDELENQDPASSSTIISLPRITHEELEDYKSKNVMGPRMLTSLMDLNEALEEIEQECQRQRNATLVLQRKQQQQLQYGISSSGALQRRYEYLQRRQQANNSSSSTSAAAAADIININSSLDESGDDNHTIVSITEQDLREKCAFFRHGESTARSTLLVLCSLKRLKQVPNKNRNVTYHLLV